MCPVCGNKTRLKIREDTELKKFPLYCPKCRQENLIEITQFKVTVITEPDAKTQSRWHCCKVSDEAAFCL
ncbi:TPA: cysteine-rich KTR domain-containing protein, partial [Salmonella enterica subsp. enterica serovar Typhimurium]|nr:cysteine-rich KTR domain-containing protein [Salmonella enterica subsp. enterica serovar Typhimurium]